MHRSTWEIAREEERRAYGPEGVRFSVAAVDGEVARAYLYIKHNDLHEAPFGPIEDV